MVSSSASSCTSYQSSPLRELTPEYDPQAAYEAHAPPHWDAEEWDFKVDSEDEDPPTTDGEDDFQFLVDKELEKEESDDYSWEGDNSFSDEEVVSDLSESPPPGKFRFGLSDEDDDDEDEEADGNVGFTSSDDDVGGSSADDEDRGSNDDDEGGSSDDGDVGAGPQIKRRRYQD